MYRYHFYYHIFSLDDLVVSQKFATERSFYDVILAYVISKGVNMYLKKFLDLNDYDSNIKFLLNFIQPTCDN